MRPDGLVTRPGRHEADLFVFSSRGQWARARSDSRTRSAWLGSARVRSRTDGSRVLTAKSESLYEVVDKGRVPL